MLRLSIIGVALLLLWGTIGCSDYPHEFEEEPLIIYDIQIHDVQSNAATIEWKTNKLVDSQLYYKTAASFERAVSNDSPKLDHRVDLTELVSSRTYYIALKGTEIENSTTVYIDGLTFDTLAN